MIKTLELANPESCLNRANDHEMLFVLLARDAAAPATIRFWIAERIRLGKNAVGDAQLDHAQMCRELMERQYRQRAKNAAKLEKK